MNFKKSILLFSTLLLVLMIFSGCENTAIDNEHDYNLETQSTNKEDIGNSGDHSDEDYN